MRVTKNEIQQFTSWLGKRSYKARVKRFGMERIQQIARENGKKGGRPRKAAVQARSKSEVKGG